MTQIDHRDPEWVAEKLGLEKNTIYRWLHDGTLPGLQIGRKWLISESELGQFLEQQTRMQTRVRRIQASKKAAGAKVMDLAYEEARRYRHTYVGQEHILLALAQLGESVATALEACGGTVQSIRGEFEQLLSPGEIEVTGKPEFTPRAKKVVDAAEKTAGKRGVGCTPEDLLSAMLNTGEGMGIEILGRLGIEGEQLKPHLMV
tara:strand:- start:13 stop:621 length:609 start_codon:yes stop_codon:yes gene_type:complete